MSRLTISMVVAVVAACAACGGEKDPFAGTTADARPDVVDEDAGQVDASPPADAAGPLLTCQPIPTRVVVLGDSITDCTVIGGPDSAKCVSKQFFDYVKANYAPSATYLNVAVGGAQTAGLAAQLQNIPAGAGHVLAMVYIGGNDLAPYIFRSDADAQTAYEEILPGVVDNWRQLFAYFEDTSKFPDGATVIMNNQYNPFDDCTASPYNLSQTKANLLHMFNIVLGDIANEKFQSTIIVDQYTSYLGHGHHYNVSTCPHYAPNTTPYMQDLIHANEAGNVHLAEQLEKGVDQLYKDCP